nr:translation initiation factor IF-2-like [Aegilops tauschii subsp. strangulata]
MAITPDPVATTSRRHAVARPAAPRDRRLLHPCHQPRPRLLLASAAFTPAAPPASAPWPLTAAARAHPCFWPRPGSPARAHAPPHAIAPAAPPRLAPLSATPRLAGPSLLAAVRRGPPVPAADGPGLAPLTGGLWLRPHARPQRPLGLPRPMTCGA